MVVNILNNLGSHSISSDRQEGLRSRKSCEAQLITTIHILMSFNKRLQTDVTVLDFLKTFDYIWQ